MWERTDPPPPRAYGRLARALHWATALLVVLLAASGIAMTLDVEEGSRFARLREGVPLYDLHKTMGLCVLALTLVRLANRVLRGAPAIEPGLPVWQRQAAAFVHRWLYLLLVLVPIMGWLGISLFPALHLFGVVHVPALATPDRGLSAGVFLAHAVLAFTLLGLACLHVGAALHHHLVRRDATLRRMLGDGGGG